MEEEEKYTMCCLLPNIHSCTVHNSVFPFILLRISLLVPGLLFFLADNCFLFLGAGKFFLVVPLTLKLAIHYTENLGRESKPYRAITDFQMITRLMDINESLFVSFVAYGQCQQFDF